MRGRCLRTHCLKMRERSSRREGVRSQYGVGRVLIYAWFICARYRLLLVRLLVLN